MIPGPYTVTMRPGGYAVITNDRTTIAEIRDERLAMADRRNIARAIAGIPDVITALLVAETWFGDMPSSNTEALDIHAAIIRGLGAMGVRLQDD